MAASLSHKIHKYGSHELQRAGAWELEDAQKPETGYWVIYIHGGAWRDPRIANDSFIPTIDKILAATTPSGAKSKIAGFASVDYRLSPHPTFPQDPAVTPADEYRGALHPDHIRDVRSALRCLQDKYGFGSRYVLLGHSAGATLALQLLMGSAVLVGGKEGKEVQKEGADAVAVALPAAIIGMEGIYDLQGLVDRLGPEYAALFECAFGDSSTWAGVSPMKFTQSFRENWGEARRLFLLGWGPDDELIDAPEISGMAEVLRRDGIEPIVIEDVKGTHDGMWEDGQPFADVILHALEKLE
ncbi:Alpha/Beta hydrolase protein [Xylariales sp. PMI_506]|nr:Alpha/Beta hydrolase protein [Xylariales sp. PMI_506]